METIVAIIGIGALVVIAFVGSAWVLGLRLGSIDSRLDADGARLDAMEKDINGIHKELRVRNGKAPDGDN